MKYGIRLSATTASVLLSTAAMQPAFAQFPDWSAVGDDLLAEQRGGFITPHGLQINFSLENVVMINGELQVHTILTMGNPAAVAAAAAAPATTAAAPAAQAAGAVAAVATPEIPATPETPAIPVAPTPLTPLTPPATLASAAAVDAAIPASLPAGATTVLASGLQTIVQNSLDQQNIQSIKIMNIEISNLRAMSTAGLNNRLQIGLIDSLR